VRKMCVQVTHHLNCVFYARFMHRFNSQSQICTLIMHTIF
jgi:hypothetical protein